MSHTVTVRMIADQIVTINGAEVNVHDIRSIEVDETGTIITVRLFDPAPQGELSRPVSEMAETVCE